MQDLYLIAHKVRGEASFDIAIQMEVGEARWWIIPTSGHRAYPFWHMPLSDVLFGAAAFWNNTPLQLPEDHPDHYAIANPPRPRAQLAAQTLESLA